MKKTIGVLAFVVLVTSIFISHPVRAEVEIDEVAPDFSLTDIKGNEVSVWDFSGSIVVLEWMNPDCPFVKKHYDSGSMQLLQRTYVEKGVIWLTINSSAPGKQGNYSNDDWRRIAAELSIASTAVLLDPTGETGKAYGAKTTPHIFIIDAYGNIAYKGAIDDKPSTDSADIAGSKNYVKAALDELIEDELVTTPSTEPYGCSVKY